jgi:hypothetical protein
MFHYHLRRKPYGKDWLKNVQNTVISPYFKKFGSIISKEIPSDFNKSCPALFTQANYIPHFNILHLPCINKVHSISITNKKNFNICEVFNSQYSHQQVSVAIAAIFRAILLREYKVKMWSAVSQAPHKN